MSFLPKYLETENIHVKDIVKKISYRFARLMNQHQFEYETMFSVRYEKQDEDGHASTR